MEEVPVDVERVDRVELDDVDEVDPHELAALHPYGPVHEVKRDGVDRVDLVVVVEVRVERVLHHDELVGVGATMRRVDDEHAVEALRDVPGERRRVTVIEVQPERLGVELVGELLADVDEAAADLLADPGRTVHHGRVDAVEVNRVRMRPRVCEVDPQQVPFAGPQRGPRDAAVVRPRGELDAGNDLDLLVVGDELPLAQHAAVGETSRLAPVEVAHDRAGVETVHRRIYGRASVREARMRRARHEWMVLMRRGDRGGDRRSEVRQPGGHSRRLPQPQARVAS